MINPWGKVRSSYRDFFLKSKFSGFIQKMHQTKKKTPSLLILINSKMKDIHHPENFFLIDIGIFWKDLFPNLKIDWSNRIEHNNN